MALIIYKDMGKYTRKPFRIAETFATIDGGVRTRMTHKCFETFADAFNFVADHEKETNNGH